jgi:small-conductance mechanosensitive channel
MIEEPKLEAEQAELEAIKAEPEVEEALADAITYKKGALPQTQSDRKLWVWTYLIFALAAGGSYFAIRSGAFRLGELNRISEKVSLAASLMVAFLLIMKLADIYFVSRLRNPVSRFNLERILKLVTGLGITFILIPVLFDKWREAVVSLGLISLILGFALQTPISSFIGWIYILARRPYRVGDRIKIGDAKGDVIDVSYLDTTLWEFGGDLSTDHPTGRIIKFPNSNVINSPVYNYSWPLFPYIWNEIRFQIAYESDLEFVASTMRAVAEEDLGEQMVKRVSTFRELLAQTPVDHLEVRERPAVFFRTSENTWIEATLRYLVEPKQAGRVKTRLIKELLKRLNRAPERVLFPKSNMR